MTEPPRPPGAGDPGFPPDPTAPSGVPGPAGSDESTAPLSGAPGPGSYPPPGGYPPPTGDQPQSGGYPPPGAYPPPGDYPLPGDLPPPGGQPPPGAGHPPPGGFPPPGAGYPGGGGYGAPTGGYASNDDKNWALIAHFGGPVGVIVGGGLLGWLAPLIALMARGQQSPTVRAHAVAALNFQLTWAIVGVLSWVVTLITCGVLFFVPMLVWLVPLIFGIVGGVKANEGVLYRYPMTYSFTR
ncbi:DUF4870 domain-containing protein [Micromonospora echinofusca]|uniref:DUF4870 domain-containing protein n=1 Tax=Micromonospora echinofusca TaxID=47858 RepID=UPI0033D5DE77